MGSSNENHSMLWKIFQENSKVWPLKVAVEDELQQPYTYAKVKELAESFSASLNLGGTRNPFVVSLLPPGIKYFVTSLATIAAHKIVVVLHDTYLNTQVEKCLKTLDYPTVLTTQEKWDSLDMASGHDYPNLYFITEDLQLEVPQTRITHVPKHQEFTVAEIENEVPLEGVGYCLFTSGSTGTPKAVLVRESSILSSVQGLIDTDPSVFNDSMRGLFGLSTGVILSLTDIWSVFKTGGTLIIPPKDIKFDIDRYRSWLTARSITAATLPLPLMELLLAKNVDKMTSLRWVIFGGARINANKIRMEGAHFTAYNAYGSTEILVATLRPISKESPITTSVGKPIGGVKIYIVDDKGQEVTSPEVTGNIYIAGNGLMAGYYGQPELNSKVLIQNPFDSTMSPVFKSGDRGYWSNTGDLHVSGRADDQIKVHGIRLELGEVETALCSFPGVSQAAVVAVDTTSDGGKQIFGFCTLRSGQEKPKSSAVEKFLLQNLQRHAMPRLVTFLDKMPINPAGKIDRVKLREMSVISCNSEENDNEPMGPVLNHWIQVVRSVWAEVLHLSEDQIQSGDNFFYLGGNSVLVFSVMDKLKQVEPKIQDKNPLLLFKFPVLKNFAGALSDDGVANIEIDFNAEIIIDFLPKSVPSAILITGTTGFLGPLLLAEALKQTENVEIFTIIRARTDEDSRKRLLAKYSVHLPGLDRVHCIAGDLTKTKFGLNDITYSMLLHKVKVIFHSAAEVSFMKTYSQLRESTVTMTKNVLKFAMEGYPKELHYMSTIGVFDSVEDLSSPVYIAAEDRIPKGVNPSKMLNGYFQSKWVSEQLVWSAVDHGLVASIYRIGQIGAHTVTKDVDSSDALAGFLVICQTMKKFPLVTINLPFVDGDVAETILRLSRIPHSRDASAKVFHLIGQEVGLEDFFDDDVCGVPLKDWELEFLNSVASAPKTEDEVNAWLFLQMIKQAEEHHTSYKRRNLMKDISFSTKETLKAGGNGFQKIHPRLYVQLLCNARQKEVNISK